MTRRTDLAVIAEILAIAQVPSCQTKIMYAGNLNHGRVKAYLSFLQGKGLIEATDHSKRTTYKTTRQGLTVLSTIRGVSNMLDGLHGNPTAVAID
jgi:predicted transcriptional regulator